ncbi:MAG: hypothetical protein DMF28_08955 [Verrucomicrobia bacterium]|nr:MAG: hypothetical protein DMF28_08955 [Verrucomicrobiota bacterium]
MKIHHGRTRPPGAPITGNKTDGSAIRPYLLLFTMLLASCAAPDTRHQIVISTREQKLAVLDRGNLMAIYPVSTSKFGLGDWPGSRYTPLGQLEIAKKIGDNAPQGAVFKDRRRTGEIVLPDSPGRDPIVTRILWLRGLEAQNTNAFTRDITLYDVVGVGAAVSIVDTSLASAIPGFVAPGTLAIR